jgi:hypothetical protein
MSSEQVQHVPRKPPRCITDLNPNPTRHSKPTLLLPPELSVYHGPYNLADTASFVIGCPCGERAVFLLGYYAETDNHRMDNIFVGPLSIECPKCGVVSEFFDTRKHGYDGEQGVNTHIIGDGNPDRFACPHCGVAPMVLCPNFCYQGVESFRGEMRDRSQDFFGGLDVVGQCTRCNAIVEIAAFECA